MRRTHLRSVLATTTCITLLVAGCGRSSSVDGDPGITANEIKIGASMPNSGPLAIFGEYGQGAKAYFNYINSQGGIDGRKLSLTIYDDAASPNRTVENVNKLVQKDKVFAIAFNFGTGGNLAVQKTLNKDKIPQLYVETGFPSFGSAAGTKEFPYTGMWMPPYSLEAAVDAEYLKDVKPDATVAVLYQNDDLGESLLAGFKQAAKGSNLKIVAAESYNISDPSVSSQMAKLAATRADAFLNFAQGTFTPQTISALRESGWSPITFIPSFDTALSVLKPAGLENAKGFLAPVYLKDPQDPKMANDEGMKKFKEVVTKYGDGADPESHNVAFGYTEAQLLVDNLKSMKSPTRDGLMDAFRNMKDVTADLLLPGITANTGPGDNYPLESVYLQQFDGTAWVNTGKKYEFEGKSDSLLP